MGIMANQIILTILTALYAFMSIFGFTELRRRAGCKEKAVYLPAYMFWIGLAGAGFFLVVGWIASVQDGSIGLTIVFGSFVLLGMLLMLGWRNCCICYDNSGFTRKNLLGIRRRFSYDQITGWCCNKRNPMESSLYAAGKKISFNLISTNGADFLATFSAGYRKTHGNHKIPEIPALLKEGGGFRAHVYNPGEYLVIFIMMVAFIIGGGVWGILIYWIPVDADSGDYQNVTFSHWEIDEDTLVLTSPHRDEPFLIGGYETYLHGRERLLAQCDGNTVFSVCARRFNPDDAPPFFRVYALSSGNEVFRSFEDSTKYNRQEIPVIAAFFGGILVFVLAFSWLIYAVGSNPRRFPRWLVNACFKKDAISY